MTRFGLSLINLVIVVLLVLFATIAGVQEDYAKGACFMAFATWLTLITHHLDGDHS